MCYEYSISFQKGHEKEALNLMSTYLPKDSGPGSAYSEGGGLYALGELGLYCLILIHSTYRIYEFNNDLLY